jgi:hypothetical protein
MAGTTLSILGFSARKDWKEVLAANIAENFFGAVTDGHLEVEIQDGPSITARTLADIFRNSDIKRSIDEQKGEPEKFENVKTYLRVLVDEVEVKKEETENLHLGKCELRILVGEKLPKKVAVLRNGMLITDELGGLKRFSSFKEFAAVLECRSDKGLSLLRAMEPPRHDDFEPDRLSPDRRHHGRTALREITKWVRDMLARHAKDPVSEITKLDEMADFFADEEETGTGRRRDENPEGAIIIRQRAVKQKARPSQSGAIDLSQIEGDDPDEETITGHTVTENGGGGGGRGGGGGTPGPGDRPSDAGTNSSEKRVSASGIALKDVRAVPISARQRRVAFTPNVTGAIVVELQDSGADANYPLDIKRVENLTVEGGRIFGLNVTAGQRTVIDVELDREFMGTLRVVANAV